ncbi:MAG: M61 family metallopeptidase [Thermoplasmata archaeon]
MLEYFVDISNPNTRVGKVILSVDKNLNKGENITVSIPNWTPGSYLIRDFARNIEKISVDKGIIEKIDKNHWIISKTKNKQIKIEYFVYMGEKSVRTSYMDIYHAQIIPPSSFLYIPDLRNEPCFIKFIIPSGWTIHTPLKKDMNGFYANNYDELVDSPIEAGKNIVVRDFNIYGKKHNVIFCNVGAYTLSKLVKDIDKITRKIYNIFGDWPNKRDYYFFIHNGVGGGLEHNNSSSITIPFESSFSPKGYYGFISTIAHEYFHMWNVRHMRTEKLINYDYDHENYTTLLWFHEGFTNYYGNIIPIKANIVVKDLYLNHLADIITSYYKFYGRNLQSLASSSFDAWIKLYRPNEESPNATISYYTIGELVAFLLNVYMIDNHGYDLDHLMNNLWFKFKDKSIPENDFIDIVSDILNDKKVSNLLYDFIFTTNELPIKEYFGKAGLVVKKSLTKEPYTGIDFAPNSTVVKYVLRDSPAEKAGIVPSDELLFVDELRAKPDNIKDLFYSTDKDYNLVLSRDGFLIKTTIKINRNIEKYELKVNKKMDGKISKTYHKIFDL